MPDDPLMNVKQAAELLSLGRSTLYARALKGDIPHIPMWKDRRKVCLRFSRADLAAWVESRKVAPK